MREFTLIESQDSILDLTVDEASALQEVGRQLAGRSEWWGQATGEEQAASVLSCTPVGPERWRVRVSDAIGVIALSSLQLSIEPKIPTSHLMFLLAASGEFPRLAPDKAVAMRDMYLWDVLLHWYMAELEALLRRGLLRDYEEADDVLPVVRGSVDAVATAGHYYRGQLAFQCRFDEFAYDSPPNRLLATAARSIVGLPTQDVLIRRRARQAAARFEEIGEFRQGDLRWRPERRSGYYGSATTLARHIIQGVGRTLRYGNDPITTFLIRTPEMVEAGIRALLRRSLAERKIEKRGIQLEGSTMRLNPDLVFDSGIAVGDVKYKLPGAEWPRSDLYQLVAFATAFRAGKGILVHFARREDEQLPSVPVGDIRLNAVQWLARADVEPAAALTRLVASVRSALAEEGGATPI